MTRILVLSDIHGNSEALRAILEEEEYDEVWVLGDLVDYGPNPGGVIDIIRSLDPPIIVRGNHDHAASYKVDCGCGPATHDLSVLTRERITWTSLSKSELDWLGKLPLEAVVEVAGMTVHITHGSPLNPLHHYLYYNSPTNDLDRATKKLKEKYGPRKTMLLHGHTHIQGFITANGVKVINPGSTGQPRDQDPRAAYIVIQGDGNSLSVSLKRKRYDVEKVIRDIKKTGLPGDAVMRLSSLLTQGRLS